MIIKTKRVTSEDKDSGNSKGIEIETKESNKPGSKFKQKVVESYKTKIKPGVSKAIQESAEDFKNLITN